MKVVKLLGLLFLVLSVAMFVVDYVVHKHLQDFMKVSVVTTGTVIDLDLSRSTSSSSSSTSSSTYHPIVSFKTEKGEAIEFRSSMGSRPPAYKKGEQVPVRYDPNDPYRAGIDTFASNWLPVIILSIFGLVFGVAGVVMVAIPVLAGRKERWLRDFGETITAELQSVELNTMVRVNGRHPYRIIAQWQDPATNEVYVFHSKNIWFNPEGHITGTELKVLIDPNNPKTYLVDTSFLPEKAG